MDLPLSEELKPASTARALPLALLAVILAGTALALAVFAARNLPNIGFWFDESVQFFISLGENPYAAPFHGPGGLADAIHFNGADNLDPGGFTILLRWWLTAGTGAVWQRTLPLSFFIIGAAALAVIGWRKYRSVPFALACGLVPALYSLLPTYATEVRAYSMEFAGVAIGCALVDRIALRGANNRLLLAAGGIFGFFLSSRYAYTLFTASAACALIATCYLRRRDKEPTTRFADLIVMAVPAMAAAVVIAVLALWPQYKARIGYDNGAMIEYFSATTAAGKSLTHLLGMLAYNLLSVSGLPLTIAALVGALALTHKLRIPVQGAHLDRIGGLIARANLLPFGLTCLAALVLSALTWRWHPWDMSSKWSLWLQGLSAVAIVQLSGTALANLRPGRLISALTEPGLILVVALLDVRLAHYQRPMWPSMVGELNTLANLKPGAETVAIDLYDYPTVRYLYEYGPLAGSPIFPAVFRFSYDDREKSLIDKQTRLLISGRTPEAAAKAFAPARILVDPEFPPHLFRVEPPPSQ